MISISMCSMCFACMCDVLCLCIWVVCVHPVHPSCLTRFSVAGVWAFVVLSLYVHVSRDPSMFPDHDHSDMGIILVLFTERCFDFQNLSMDGGWWDEQAIVQTGGLFEDALLKLRVEMSDLYICPRCTPRPYPGDAKKNNDTTLETTVRRIINSSVLLLCACCVHIYNQSHIYNPFITGVLHQLVDVYQPYGVSTVKRGSLGHNHTLHAGHPSILLSYSSSRRSNWYCRCCSLASSVIVFIVSGVCSA